MARIKRLVFGGLFDIDCSENERFRKEIRRLGPPVWKNRPGPAEAVPCLCCWHRRRGLVGGGGPRAVGHRRTHPDRHGRCVHQQRQPPVARAQRKPRASQGRSSC